VHLGGAEFALRSQNAIRLLTSPGTGLLESR
jgi:hypothetical protein